MNAKDLKTLSIEKSIGYKEAVDLCKQEAEKGFTQRVFHDKRISEKGCDELMRNGFTIGIQTMFDGVEFQRVCW